VQVDIAYLGGERCGGSLVRGSENKCGRWQPSLSMRRATPGI